MPLIPFSDNYFRIVARQYVDGRRVPQERLDLARAVYCNPTKFSTRAEAEAELKADVGRHDRRLFEIVEHADM